MGINRRRGNRRTFNFNKNYIIPFICITITCLTIVISTNIILNLKEQIPQQNQLVENEQDKIQQINLTDKEKLQLNNMFSFLISNLDIGQELSNEIAQYMLTCKYYAKENTFNQVNEEFADMISPDVYRNLGYVYFDDYKDVYMYIKKADYEDTYRQLFDEEQLKNLSQYYIPNLDGYVVPKNNAIYDNSRYKVVDVIYDSSKEIYTATLYEINILKLYEDKEYTQVEQYLNSTNVDSNYLTGKLLKISLKKIDNNFVFVDYAI